MSAQPQITSQVPFPGFSYVFHRLDILKSHLESLQKGLQLAQQQKQRQQQQEQQQQQQSYSQTTSHPPGAPPQYGLPPIAETSPPQPHPHVYGRGYVQAQSCTPSSPGGCHCSGTGHLSDEAILTQVNAAYEGIGPAKTALNQAIGALRSEAEAVYERIGSITTTEIPSMKPVEKSCRGRDVARQRRQLGSAKECVVM